MLYILSKVLSGIRSLLGQTPGPEALPEVTIESNLDIILLLASRQTPFTQKELCKILHIGRPEMELLIEGLTAYRYIFTERNNGDRGDRLIHLTYLGKEYVPSIQCIIE